MTLTSLQKHDRADIVDSRNNHRDYSGGRNIKKYDNHTARTIQQTRGTLFKNVESATAFCKRRGNPYVELEHWLHQVMQLPDGDLHHCHTDIAVMQRDMVRSLATLPAGAGSISDFSHQIETAIEPAWVFPTPGFDDNRVRGAWLVTAVVKAPKLRRILLGISPAFKNIPLEGWTKHCPHGSTVRRNLRTCLTTELIFQTRRMRWALVTIVPLGCMAGVRRFVAWNLETRLKTCLAVVFLPTTAASI